MKRSLLLLALLCGVIVAVVLLPENRADDAQSKPMHLAPSAGEVPADYFGMHIHREGTSTPWPTVPFDTWRLWDAHVAWPDLEPQPGKWNFTLLDSYLKLAEDHHVRVLLPLALSPKWASARPNESSTYQPGFAAEPRQMTDWDNYVRAVVQHCKGRVQAYEIWNEPNYKIFWSGQTDQLVNMTKDAHDIIKSVDPHAIVVSPSATSGTKGVAWLNDFLQQGGGRYVDVIGFHFYAQTPEAMVPLIEQVKQSMTSHQVGSLAVWNTETGWAKPKPFPSAELGAAYLTRAYLLNWAAGVKRLYWYAWDNHSFVSIETTESDNASLTPAGRAYGTVHKWLVGAQLQSCDMALDHTWTCSLQRDHRNEWVVWNQDREIDMSLPKAWRAQTSTNTDGNASPITTPSLHINQMPQLITGGRHQ